MKTSFLVLITISFCFAGSISNYIDRLYQKPLQGQQYSFEVNLLNPVYIKAYSERIEKTLFLLALDSATKQFPNILIITNQNDSLIYSFNKETINDLDLINLLVSTKFDSLGSDNKAFKKTYITYILDNIHPLFTTNEMMLSIMKDLKIDNLPEFKETWEASVAPMLKENEELSNQILEAFKTSLLDPIK